MVKLTTFEAGYCTHLACMAQKGAGLHICKFPARAWLIEVGNKRWLWDTGYADYFYQSTQRGIFKLYRKLTPVYLQEQEALKRQFLSLGIELSSIDGVILSHFHGDHIAGIRDFSCSHFICSGEGWKKLRTLRGFRALKQGFVPELMPEDFEERLIFLESFVETPLPQELWPFTVGYVLPGSQKQVLIVPLPGHACGHVGAFVQTDHGWTLLASDAAWTPANYQQLQGPSKLAHLVMENPRLYYQTLQKLHQLARNPQITICLSHEGYL